MQKFIAAQKETQLAIKEAELAKFVNSCQSENQPTFSFQQSKCPQHPHSYR